MPTPEDPRAESPISDYDFWMVKKGEKLGTQLSGYVRVMSNEEAENIRQTGVSISDEWFEVWDGLLPPVVYGLIEWDGIQHQSYQHVMFFTADAAEKAGIKVLNYHGQYNKMHPGVSLSRINDRGLDRSQFVELTELVKTKILMLLLPRRERVGHGEWQYAGIARQRVV